MKFLLHVLAIIVVWSGVMANLSVMLRKAAVLFRGSLTGNDLDIALIGITAIPAAAILGLCYLYNQIMLSYHKRVLKECTKCACDKCGEKSSTSGLATGSTENIKSGWRKQPKIGG